MVEIECLWECNDGLGETPIWREEEGAIYWADHVGPAIDPGAERRPTIKRLNPATRERTVWPMPEQIGSFGFRAAGGIVAGANSGFCYVDLESGSLERIVDPEPGKPRNRLNDGKIVFPIAALPPAIVDGATVDADGCYWFALNLGGKILRVDPRGRVDRTIDMPVRSPTCVTFGGDRYETLYVTSQQAFVTPEEMTRHPRPGSLFAIHGLGVQGLPEPRFAA